MDAQVIGFCPNHKTCRIKDGSITEIEN